MVISILVVCLLKRKKMPFPTWMHNVCGYQLDKTYSVSISNLTYYLALDPNLRVRASGHMHAR